MISIANIVSNPDEWYEMEKNHPSGTLTKAVTKPYRLIEKEMCGMVSRICIFDIEKDLHHMCGQSFDNVNVPPQDLDKLGPWLKELSSRTTKICVRDWLKEYE